MADLTKLTGSQRAVVALLAAGYTTKGTAAFLGISPKTAQIHISAALRRSHAQHRAHLVAEFMRDQPR